MYVSFKSDEVNGKEFVETFTSELLNREKICCVDCDFIKTVVMLSEDREHFISFHQNCDSPSIYSLNNEEINNFFHREEIKMIQKVTDVEIYVKDI
jgi:hypothetical protein